MSSFYVASQGQQQGPFSLKEIETYLLEQKFNWHDYIYDDHAQDWVLLLEFAPLTHLFNQSFATPIRPQAQLTKENDPLKKRIWYVLKQNNNFGPFSKYEIIQMLQNKTLHEFDFIWHEGLASWKKLADVHEFSMAEIKAVFEASKSNSSKPSNEPVFFRRKFVRAKLNAHAIVHDKNKIYKSVSVEVSEGGAALHVEGAEFQINQQVYLHFKPGLDVPAFNAICKIVSKNGDLYGVQFIKISAAAKNSIANYTKKKAAA